MSDVRKLFYLEFHWVDFRKTVGYPFVKDCIDALNLLIEVIYFLFETIHCIFNSILGIYDWFNWKLHFFFEIVKIFI